MKFKYIILSAAAMLALSACDRVKPGHVGVLVDNYSDRGVEEKPVGVGSYFVYLTKTLYQFPTYQQTAQWTEENGRAIRFQSKEGAVLVGDFAITYQIDPSKVPILFQTYRDGIDDITNGPIHNAVRDFLGEYASTMTTEEVYSIRRSELLHKVTEAVRAKFAPFGIQVDTVSALSDFDMNESVKTAINNKIVAYQESEAKHNMIASEQAQQEINRVKAQGEAAAIIEKANGTAKANQTIAHSLTPELIQFEALQKWDGKLPTVSGSTGISTLIGMPK